MARFGLLYLNNGRWENRQIIPEKWVKASTREHIRSTLFKGYGYQWWVEPGQYYLAAGYMGQFIFVIPSRNMVAVFTGNLESNDFYVPKRLLDQYIIPSAVSSDPLPGKPVNKMVLDILVKDWAKAPVQGGVWTSREQGIAEKGIFIRSASPAFQFKYPVSSRKTPLEFPGQVMTMKTPDQGSFSASVTPAPQGISLSDIGPDVFAGYLEESGSKVKVLSNKEIRLKDGSKAYRTEIDWLWKSSFIMKTLLVSVLKDDKWIFLTWSGGTLWEGPAFSGRVEKGAAIVESLTLGLL